MSWIKRLPGLFVPILVIVALSAVTADAQPAPEASSPRTRTPATAASLASRGQQVFVQHCAFCHGADARGGAQGGSDLMQSPIVLEDEGRGANLGKFLAVGRPEKNMPKFTLPRQRIAELAAFLHARRVAAASSSHSKADILVGDPKAGADYFNGAGRCTTCHSVTTGGDLARIGAKYDPVMLQGRMVVPRGRGGWPGGDNAGDLPLRATVTLPSGESVSGDVLYLSDFYVTLKDASGKRHTIDRRGGAPEVEIADTLHAHVAMLRTLSDKTIHDLTAYLATLK